MGVLEAFSIVLDQPNAVYSGGQLILGRVLLSLNEPLKMRENASGDKEMHPAGSYIYPFLFPLPSALPSSFAQDCGSVHYSIKGTIDRPWRLDYTCETPFTVRAIMGNNPALTAKWLACQRKKQVEKQKTVCCFCCASGTISATMVLDRTGYEPGDVIFISGRVENDSRRRIAHTEFTLTQHVTYRCKAYTTSRSRKVATLYRDGPIEPGDMKVYDRERLHIPQVPDSPFLYCRIIDITYKVNMCVVPSGPACALTCVAELTIGHVRRELEGQSSNPVRRVGPVVSGNTDESRDFITDDQAQLLD